MTLKIDVIGIEKCLVSKGVIYVENGQAGALVSPKFSSKSDDFKNSFKIMCSSQDSLTFKICQESSNVKKQTVVGTTQFIVPTYLKNYGQFLIENDNQAQYELDVYAPNEMYAGTIKMKIIYDKSSLFMGEIAEDKKEKKRVHSNVGFYKGACPSKNLFNCVDPEVKQMKFKFVESIYQDEVQTVP